MNQQFEQENQKKVLLKTEALTIRFGGLIAVNDVSLEINEGEIFGIIGPNGAGKTTLFNMCSGIYKPTSGKVYFDGEDLSKLRPENICRLGLARTFQNIKLFNNMSVMDNVFVGFHHRTKSGFADAIFHTSSYKQTEKQIREETLELLDMLGLIKFKDTKAAQLSYGMQRKVEIARALATKPRLLLLDEPAAGMNPSESQELSEYIHNINRRGFTVALIEHDMRFVMSTCHRLVVLNFGKKICEGLPEEVRCNKEVEEAYFGKSVQ